MSRLSAVTLILVAVASLAACTSAPKAKETRCAGVDWWEMGRTDGVAGIALQKGLAEHKLQCEASSHPVDLELYENGRDAGLIDYCSPQQGLAVGHAGSNYEGVCPSYLEVAFLAQYKVGQRLHELETEDHELESRIENLVSLLSKSNSGTALRAQIEDLRSRRANLDVEMARLEATSTGAPLPDAVDPILTQANPVRLPASAPAKTSAPTQTPRVSKESLRSAAQDF